jgi:hypothetical protein
MDITQSVIYRVDAADRLVGFNAGWPAFANANRGGDLLPASLLGRSLWDFIADATTSHLYHVMTERLRNSGPRICFRFRCDAPARRRLLAMEMTSEGMGGIRFCVDSVLEEARQSIPLLEPDFPRDERFITMCGWCKQLRLSTGAWAEIEMALEMLGLLGDASPAPAISHGICPPCHRAILSVIHDRTLGAAGTVSLGPIPAAPATAAIVKR